MGWLHRFAQRLDRFARLFQPLAALAQPVFEQTFDVGAVVAVEGFARVVLDRLLQRLEEVLVVDDVAIFLVVAVEPVDPADGLEETVVPHLLVDVEVGGGRRIEAGEQFVDDDEQFHLPRLFDEALFDLFLELLDLVHGRLFGFVEVGGQHLAVDLVLVDLFGLPFAALLAFDVGGRRLVGGDDRALARQIALLEHLEEAAGRVDAVANKKGVPVHCAAVALSMSRRCRDNLGEAVAALGTSASCPNAV